VIVVGNITLGGTGKSPLIEYLVKFLQQQGYKPGVISRGYRAKSENYPLTVTKNTAVAAAGDEAVMLARNLNIPIVVDPNRPRAAKELLQHNECDVILSDDGLQHYWLGRDIEIAVVDGSRRLGNRQCLPAGVLREPVSRLQTVDFIVTNGVAAENEYGMQIMPAEINNLVEPSKLYPQAQLQQTQFHAVTGIGNPQRFFDMLTGLGIRHIPHCFPDHYKYKKQDLEFDDNLPILMTAKDAVKCDQFAHSNYWVLPITATVGAEFNKALLTKLALLSYGDDGVIGSGGMLLSDGD